MDAAMRRELVELIRGRGIAALGTLQAGAPLVSMVLYAASPDLSAVLIHVSRLAQHTGGLLRDRRVGLLIAEPDKPSRNPLSMARVSIQADAEPLEGTWKAKRPAGFRPACFVKLGYIGTSVLGAGA